MSKLIHKPFLLAIGLIALVALSIFLFRPRPAPLVVRIGYLNITASMPLFVAEEKGFFTEEAVKYEAVPMATSNHLVDGILSGNLDLFVESSAVPVLAAQLQSPGRQKVFSVSSITKDTPFDTLIVRSDSKIKTLSDLSGKTIGVFPGSTATNLLRTFLVDSGVDTSKITFVPIPPQNQLTALLEGSLDAVHAYEPTTAIALSTNGKVRRLYGSVYAEMLSPNPQGVAVISSKFLVDHTEAAKRTIHALERAMIFMKDNDTETRRIMAKRMNIESSIAEKSVFLYMLPHKEIDALIFQKYADMLSRLGELKGQVAVDSLLYND